jgi:hypothetical protein
MDKILVKRHISRAFEDLRKQGFLAKENFLCCQTCAGYDLTIEAEKLIKEGKEVNGCVYWHGQDEDNWNEIGQMFLAYGEMESEKCGTIGLPTKEVGKLVMKALKKHHVPCEWNGDPSRRILVSCKEVLDD